MFAQALAEKRYPLRRNWTGDEDSPVKNSNSLRGGSDEWLAQRVDGRSDVTREGTVDLAGKVKLASPYIPDLAAERLSGKAN